MTDTVLVFDLGPGDEQLFIDESLEQIEAIESGLLALERGESSADVVNAIFRGAHTLKGSAGAIRHARMAALTHALEDIFGESVTSPIHTNVKISEAPFHFKTVLEYDPESRGAKDFQALVNRILQDGRPDARAV